MHKRSFEERCLGCWVVVVDDISPERFYNEKDALEYKQWCIDTGSTAYIHHIESVSEDDYYSYYFN